MMGERAEMVFDVPAPEPVPVPSYEQEEAFAYQQQGYQPQQYQQGNQAAQFEQHQQQQYQQNQEYQQQQHQEQRAFLRSQSSPNGHLQGAQANPFEAETGGRRRRNAGNTGAAAAPFANELTWNSPPPDQAPYY
mmetsp:Transcript_5750/g.12658  ORF Transcript_5750/g.12658 Transcript_5750/m.12658 type:complete len:134 (-) Transcript_5750:358-759(-)